MSGRAAACGAAAAAALLLGACATVQVPPGGPVDEQRPRVVSLFPDSGAVALGEVRELRISFSEKTDKTAARGWLTVFPHVPIAGTDWDGRRTARVSFQEPLPADTVIVVEVGPGLKDMHGVAMGRPRTWPLATAAALPQGAISGSLVYENKPAVGAVVELLPAEKPGARAARQPLRRTVADSSGSFRLEWLPVPGGPWRVRAFVDNGDLKPAENEATRLVADVVGLGAEAPQLDLGLKIIYRPGTPGELEGAAPDTVPWPGPLLVFSEPLPTGEQTEKAPPLHSPRRPRKGRLQRATPGEPIVLDGVPPGLVRVIFFVDADLDSALSLLPEPAGPGGRLEPLAVVDSLTVSPGLRTSFAAPAFADTLVLAVADTSAAAGRGRAAGPGGER